jgi:hypothetical protein
LIAISFPFQSFQPGLQISDLHSDRNRIVVVVLAMLALRHALKVLKAVVVLNSVPMVDDDLRIEVFLAVSFNEKARAWIVLQQPAFHHKAMLENIVAVRARIDVPARMNGFSAFPSWILLSRMVGSIFISRLATTRAEFPP